MAALFALPAHEIARRVKAREISAAEATEAALARLDAVNPKLNAVTVPLHAEARAAAAAVDAAIARGEDPGILAGVPVTTKETTDQKGQATTMGLVSLKDNIAAQDSPVIQNLRKAGAVIVGRTNTPAFATRWFTSNDLFGATKNPWNPALTPGGSSGGASAAVAAGIGAIAHGTDAGGSIRYPAYACGVHGLRPTLGRVPAWNAAMPERDIGGQLMAVQGPLARCMEDVKLGLLAMMARDIRDPWYAPVPFAGPEAPKRVALCVAPEGMQPQAPVTSALLDAAARLADAGYEVVEVDALPPLREALKINLSLWTAFLPRGGMAAVEKEGEQASLDSYRHMLKIAPPVGLDAYQDLLTRRATLLRQWLVFFDEYPLVLCPVSGEVPFPDQLDTQGWDAFARLVEAQTIMLGTPALGLPGLAVATGEQGRVPLGIQLLAGRFREDLLLAAGAEIEKRGLPELPVEPE
jgi:amidase